MLPATRPLAGSELSVSNPSKCWDKIGIGGKDACDIGLLLALTFVDIVGL